ncbi:hypothetical protein FKM82_030964 [Ascaphus truei]
MGHGVCPSPRRVTKTGGSYGTRSLSLPPQGDTVTQTGGSYGTWSLSLPPQGDTDRGELWDMESVPSTAG